MIPVAIVLGFLGGSIPRLRLWSIPLVGVVWSSMLSFGGDPSLTPVRIWTAGFLLGAVNGAVGALAATGLWSVTRLALLRWRNRPVAP